MPPDEFRILIVDDEKHIVTALTLLLEADFTVRGVPTAEDALAIFEEYDPHLVLLDITLPGMDGMELLQLLKERYPSVEVVMVTANSQVRTAVNALKLGAYDYLEKGFEEEDLRAVIRNAQEKIDLSSRVKDMGGELARPYSLDNIVGDSPAMRQVLEHIQRMCSRELPVLIHGESGTGKELIARAIHYNGTRRYGPFVSCNCARLTGDLIESELFGHERGAFTGATELRRGLFERASGGTLFLDEIRSMPPTTQGRFLRVLEERSFTRLGGERPIASDFRLLAASNVGLRTEVDVGRFREDLFFRLNVYPITAPPLRERPEDIPPLIRHFIRKHRVNMQSRLEGFTPEAMEELKNHSWRGNVRELENTVVLLMSLSDKRLLDVEDLNIPVVGGRGEMAGGILRRQKASVEKELVLRVLEESGWNQTTAAERLRVHRNTLRNLMNRYGIRLRRSDAAT